MNRQVRRVENVIIRVIPPPQGQPRGQYKIEVIPPPDLEGQARRDLIRYVESRIQIPGFTNILMWRRVRSERQQHRKKNDELWQDCSDAFGLRGLFDFDENANENQS